MRGRPAHSPRAERALLVHGCLSVQASAWGATNGAAAQAGNAPPRRTAHLEECWESQWRSGRQGGGFSFFEPRGREQGLPWCRWEALRREVSPHGEERFEVQFVEPAASGRLPPHPVAFWAAGVSRPHCSERCLRSKVFSQVTTQRALCGELPLRPNPSLEPTRSGKAARPPRAQFHVALVGRAALPPRSPQLKR